MYKKHILGNNVKAQTCILIYLGHKAGLANILLWTRRNWKKLTKNSADCVCVCKVLHVAV